MTLTEFAEMAKLTALIKKKILTNFISLSLNKSICSFPNTKKCAYILVLLLVYDFTARNMTYFHGVVIGMSICHSTKAVLLDYTILCLMEE